jgi:hypothetical protein
VLGELVSQVMTREVKTCASLSEQEPTWSDVWRGLSSSRLTPKTGLFVSELKSRAFPR